MTTAPESTFVLLDGSKINTASFKGKVTLVNFWATSCTTCVAEMPKIISTYDKYKAKGFDTVAVAMSYDPPAYVVNYAETRNSGQIQRIAQFLAGVWGVDKGLKLECLLSLDQSIGDDMLAVLNAIRTNVLSIRDMSVDGSERVPDALRLWGYQ